MRRAARAAGAPQCPRADQQPRTTCSAGPAFLVVTVLGAVLTYLARARAATVGEDVLASLRSRLLARTVTLPLATVERAGTGELLARMIGDVAALAGAVRYALPSMALAAIELLLAGGALLLDAGVVTLGTVTAAAFYVLRLVGPINILIEFLDRLQTAGAALARIAGVLDLADPPAAAPPPAAWSGRAGRASPPSPRWSPGYTAPRRAPWPSPATSCCSPRRPTPSSARWPTTCGWSPPTPATASCGPHWIRWAPEACRRQLRRALAALGAPSSAQLNASRSLTSGASGRWAGGGYLCID
ncbi:MAG: hypothetical protein GEU83_13525 [Pseudonocardiaceae bacterium]|nr:hypothetical protein [Pseudonocardiaceae bacterium]